MIEYKSEQERLASLGRLAGGIVHNLKTPIMSISGAVEGLRNLVAKYEQSIYDQSVTTSDHREIASDMHTLLNQVQAYCSYMSDIVDTVKGQATTHCDSNNESFTIHELVKRIELLLKHEMLRLNCILNTDIKMDFSTELYGDVNCLVQVFDNIIVNAIQAYEGKKGRIDLVIEEDEGSILFAVRDYAKGIPVTVKEKLLKEMVTTKGVEGTGLGMMISNSIVKARFQGKMWFKSIEGKGTTFYVRIPRKK
ncbi:MAG: HAMP domain-containing histidine kinase [Clostridiaceae bacterium]|jgi:signal transduction histidine kinase|nr:HAMP domain-containing histidine kinase [Clostridiaceae bacterium]